MKNKKIFNSCEGHLEVSHMRTKVNTSEGWEALSVVKLKEDYHYHKKQLQCLKAGDLIVVPKNSILSFSLYGKTYNYIHESNICCFHKEKDNEAG